MKKLILFMITLTSLNAFSASFYSCEGFAGVDEYRVGINLKTSKAGFFDNDSTSYMTLKDVRVIETSPSQVEMTFVGKEISFAGGLKLIFNQTKKTASLYSINSNGQSKKIGSAPCREEKESWDDLN